VAQHLTRIVRNQSERSARPDTIIIHTTEGHNRPGVSDLLGLAGWFNNPSAQASSHFGVDQEGNTIRMVADERKAWTSGDWNSRSLNIEHVGFASTSNSVWRRTYRKGLWASALIAARWCLEFNIPVRRKPGNGFCGHRDVSGPGGHTDPGENWPWKVYLLMVRIGKLKLHNSRRGLRRRWRAVVAKWLER
jgi:N-acetyl-anhydromuramyl-L-alanine amidase AmpD